MSYWKNSLRSTGFKHTFFIVFTIKNALRDYAGTAKRCFLGTNTILIILVRLYVSASTIMYRINFKEKKMKHWVGVSNLIVSNLMKFRVNSSMKTKKYHKCWAFLQPWFINVALLQSKIKIPKFGKNCFSVSSISKYVLDSSNGMFLNITLGSYVFEFHYLD